MAENTRIHPETGETLRRGVQPMTVSYANYSKVVDVPGGYPEGDGDAIHTGKDLSEWNEVYRQMRTDYARKVRSLRLRLNLTHEEAGRVLGGGKRAFQKYGKGRRHRPMRPSHSLS